MGISDHALFILDLFFAITFKHQREKTAFDPHCGFDHIRNVFFFGLVIKIRQIFAAQFLMRRQIKVRAARNPLDFAPAHRKQVFQIIVPLE